MTEEELKRFFAKHQIKATINHYISSKRAIYYATIGEDHLPALLFIHGSPASLIIYKDYFTDQELLKHFSLYAVDRFGYGVTNDGSESSVQKQAQVILPLAERIHRVHQPLIVVADSNAASIVCSLVMNHPQIVQALVFSPLLVSGLEKKHWLASLLHKTFLRNFISKKYLSATAEKKLHQHELNKMIMLSDKIQIPVFYLDSEKNSIIFSDNSNSAKNLLTNSPFLNVYFFKRGNQNVYYSYQKEIRNKILELYQML